jgi:adenine-specific DNA-methyltransferase
MTTSTKRAGMTIKHQGIFEFAIPESARPVQRPTEGRYAEVSDRKASGATYTPQEIAEYLSVQLVDRGPDILERDTIRVLDPAIGDGALALALLGVLTRRSSARISVVGYETNPVAAAVAKRALEASFAHVAVDIRERDFLTDRDSSVFDLAIANPPYVRTQIMGAEDAGILAARFGLEGRVDLYQAFALALIERLVPEGGLALITSNRFLTTKGAAAFRDALHAGLAISRLWDLGDTKIFDAAVLPAMLVGRRRSGISAKSEESLFTSVYEQRDVPGTPCASLAVALEQQGEMQVGGRTFRVQQGQLRVHHGDIWRLSSAGLDTWLLTVRSNTWRRLGEIGKIRVGVKTTADKVFIRSDWSAMGAKTPELLRPLITHHVAERYRARETAKQILYPHLDHRGRREVANLANYPHAAAYLEMHRDTLEARKYVIDAGRKWYEIWVPQEPALWTRPKLVFRDIAEKPTFWIDKSGGVVNGDCYWMVTDDAKNEDILWLAAAVTNSTFIEAFYDHCFNNKLYAGRRRFMSQYVEQFPLPDPSTSEGEELVALAKRRHDATDASTQARLEIEIDERVWTAFGLPGGRASDPLHSQSSRHRPTSA